MSRGTYLSFKKVWDEEGQDQDGFNAAMLYCSRATKLGSKWTRLNGMTDRVEFLYLRKEFTETLSEKWAMYALVRLQRLRRLQRSVDELNAPSSLKQVIA